jgi:Domain of Unknown Function (DUF1206)
MNSTLVRHGQRATEDSMNRVESGGRRLAERERARLVPLGRAGFAANGLVYVIVGALAVEAAMGVGGATTDPGGALGHILGAPFGRVLLGLVALGLAGYAVWRLLQAVLDTEHKGRQPQGLAQRFGFGFAAASYAGLALSAVAMALNRGAQPNEDQSIQDRTAWLMSQPFGRWLVIAVGFIVLAVAIGQFVSAYRASFQRALQDQTLSPEARRLVRVAGRLGYLARGIAFGLIGTFLVVAGWQARPEQARGLGGALETLANQPFGPWLLGLVGVGLVGYGIHMLVSARYRRMVLS